ncbi:hypothetical protein [Corynebacterium alimapuense]|uniref:Uncharacterized protein n=1 Tax=Corynebacterium alimapuense TaxID=1576874 RepID=A0A3M8K8Y0_9CORY|nr:hypothetical protein [Corynebacterium alimapuense]RNE49586.1 hypothetical protein C5L39_04375 [Corynebacterium alimapuense]
MLNKDVFVPVAVDLAIKNREHSRLISPRSHSGATFEDHLLLGDLHLETPIDAERASWHYRQALELARNTETASIAALRISEALLEDYLVWDAFDFMKEFAAREHGYSDRFRSIWFQQCVDLLSLEFGYDAQGKAYPTSSFSCLQSVEQALQVEAALSQIRNLTNSEQGFLTQLRHDLDSSQHLVRVPLDSTRIAGLLVALAATLIFFLGLLPGAFGYIAGLVAVGLAIGIWLRGLRVPSWEAHRRGVESRGFSFPHLSLR